MAQPLLPSPTVSMTEDRPHPAPTPTPRPPPPFRGDTPHKDDTVRAVYAVRFEAAVYVPHAFRKKARRGTVTPKRDLDLVRRRLAVAERHYLE